MTYGTMIDCEGSQVTGLLAALGSNNPDTFATYVTGAGDVPASARELSDLAARAGLFKYDQTAPLNSFGQGLADGADIENLAGTFPNAVSQTVLREAKGWLSWWYIPASELETARGLVTQNGFKKTRFIVANWDLSQAEAQAFIVANEDVDAVQWASPSSNPNTVCPGTNRTLSELNVDLNVTRPGWFTRPVTVPTQAPKYKGVVVTDSLTAKSVTSNDGVTWAA